MKLCQFVLKLISPKSEKERMDFRHDMARVRAITEDLSRTVVNMDTRKIAKDRGNG